MTRESPRALDQLAQLGVGREMHAKAIGRKRLEFTSAPAHLGNRGGGAGFGAGFGARLGNDFAIPGLAVGKRESLAGDRDKV